MKATTTAVLMIGMSLSGIAMADCQSNLSAEETIDCINYEGATNSYVDEDIKDIHNSSNKQEKSEIATVEVKN